MREPIKIVLVGCGQMGQHQAKILAGISEFQLTAVADINPANAQAAAAIAAAKPYSDFHEMLVEQRPDAVAICTPNDSHAAYTLTAAQFPGVRGIYCEKPMATNLADARAMVAACRERKIPLVINHQRRIGADLTEARRLIQEGILGPIALIRGQCAGDLLSDGTHLMDSMMFLAGEEPIEWVLGQIHRVGDARRFGHVVESGALAVVHFASGLRGELLCGDIRDPNSPYHDLQIFGASGRLWRRGDKWPNLFLQPARDGRWQSVPMAEPKESAIHDGYRRFAEAIRDGPPHPMNGEIALRGFEALMAIYESARLHRKITLPLQQDRFPLELMIEEGRWEPFVASNKTSPAISARLPQ